MSLETSVILQQLLSSLVILLVSGALFLPLLAFAFRAAESIVKKAFFNNMAKQAATAGFICGLAFAALAAASAYFIAFSAAGERYSAALTAGLIPANALPVIFSLLGGLAALQLAHLALWKKLRKLAALQLLVLVGSIMLCFSGAVSFLYFLQDVGYMPESAALLASCVWFSNALGGLVFPLDLYRTAAFAASAAAGCALGVCWLLLRRNADDFGRDYYNFAVSRCAGITFAFGAIALLLQGIYTGMGLSRLMQYSFDILAFPLAVLALRVVSCIIWLLAFKSRAPLRHKAGLWLSLLLWAVSCGLLAFI